ncbi:MAG: bifunctional 5,10-methylenetetrahydrofolate dehydrogenase/5,10-methenyltetrahydrofolate cyclohydrolase [Longimicrobiaceae bacterium]
MTARILAGTELARELRAGVAEQVAELRDEGTVPGLAVLLVGGDPASEVYVRMKVRASTEAGMNSRTIDLPAEVSADELFGAIDGLNADPGVHGVLVQLPLPAHLPYKQVLERISPLKDVDGFHPLNVGRSFSGDHEHGFLPATPAGILELMSRYQIPTHGRHAVIVGRSLIVGKPLASLLIAPGYNATATLTHKYTVNLSAHTRSADILIVAVGKPGIITADMVKPGATVIDVGVSRVNDPASERGYRIAGDVDSDAVSEVAGAITPVPGGVGPMTIAMLLRNTLTAARRLRAAGVVTA